MRHVLGLLTATAACALAPIATAHAQVEAGIGPFKVKGGYTGLATLEDAGNRKAKVTLVLRRAGATFEQKHTYEIRQTVRVRHSNAFKRATITGKFGKLGSVKLRWSTKAKEDSPVGAAAGCEGNRGMGKKGVFKGRFLLKTGDPFFKTIDVRRTKGALYLPESYVCGYSEEREDNNAFVRFGESGDFPFGTSFFLVATDFDSQPNQVIDISLSGRGPLLVQHELFLFRDDHAVMTYDAPRATITGRGPFLSGSAEFTPDNPNCKSFVEGKVKGDLLVKLDSPGPVRPFAEARDGSFSSPASTEGC